MHSISFHVHEEFFSHVSRLPWQKPIEEWEDHGVRTLKIKSGASRHPIVFLDSDGVQFAVKQLSVAGARREISNYTELLRRGIGALQPVGYVTREEEPIPFVSPTGLQYEENLISHTITLLAEKVLPDSQLYRRAFKFENRKRIWDAVVELFVDLHLNGIYWGDASLANTLIHFETEELPQVGKRTVLKGILADAETVEVHKVLSDGLRKAELDFFLESMHWINEDLRASGILREELGTRQDQEYILERYSNRFDVARKEREFERDTLLKVRELIGDVSQPVYVDIVRQHIEEHKWYLSERGRSNMTLAEAAKDWYEYVFLPVCALFRELEVLEHFPGKTASDLYVEIMTNKYYLSRGQGKDVGILYAMKDYSAKFGVEENSFAKTLKKLSRRMLGILGLHKQSFLQD